MKRGYLAIGVLFLFVASACSVTVSGPTESRDDSFSVGDSPTVVVCCQSATMGQIGTRENCCYGEATLSFLTVRL
jgi:hypothetical protein